MKKTFALVLFSFFAFSCSFEYKALKLYQEKIPETKLLILFPDELLKVNAKSGLDYSELSWNKYDSLIKISDFLDKLNDSVFKESFKQNLKANFQNVGYKVYFENQWESFKSDSNSYIVIDFKQWELEEKFIDKQFYDVIGEYEYEENFVVNALSLNIWVEVSSTDTLYPFSKTLFFDNTITDDVNGYFAINFFNQDAVFKYTYDSLDVNELKNLPILAAENTVKKISYYNLNKYMDIRIKDKYGRNPDSYYIFSNDYKHIYPSVYPLDENITIVKDFQ